MARPPWLWEMSYMAGTEPRRGISKTLRERLEAIRPPGLPLTQWCEQAQVSTSFFTDLRKGSEPGIDKVDRLVGVAGLTLAEFLAGDDRPRIDLPTEDELTQLLAGVQRELPASLPFAAWPRAAASALRTRLEQLAHDRANYADSSPDAPAEGAQLPAPTTRGARA